MVHCGCFFTKHCYSYGYEINILWHIKVKILTLKTGNFFFFNFFNSFQGRIAESDEVIADLPYSKEKQALALEKKEPKFHLLSVLAVLIPHMKFTQQETRMETLRWLMWLHKQLPRRVCDRSSDQVKGHT